MILRPGPSGQRQVLPKRLSELTMPTLIIWGTTDWVIPITHGRPASRRRNSGGLVRLSWCGHAPQVECPEGFTQALSRFLRA
jgi:pimeloyl-ACP methyl ester carboxylesterase